MFVVIQKAILMPKTDKHKHAVVRTTTRPLRKFIGEIDKALHVETQSNRLLVILVRFDAD